MKAEIMNTFQAQIKIYGVTEVNHYLKELVWEDQFLRGLWLKGEISGYKEHSSGHIYFSLKEGLSTLRCVMFRRYTGNLEFRPQNGMEVLAFGGVSLYERDGNCQLYAEEMIPAGAGAHFLALEQLKKRLEGEGLFAVAAKKPLPRFAQTIGVITSPEGAAWQDIQRVARSRFDNIRLQLFPSLVQGEKAAESLVSAIGKADLAACDILIVARGGGSYEDLAAFDYESVVRAIAQAKTPLICGVGHESDFSLADLAADVRATTPTHAAQLAVPNKEDLINLLDNYRARLSRAYKYQLADLENRLERLTDKPVFTQPGLLLEAKERQLEELKAGLLREFRARLSGWEKDLALKSAKLEMLSPLAVMGKGYAICTDEEGRNVNQVSDLNQGDKLNITMLDGQAACRIENIQQKGGK